MDIEDKIQLSEYNIRQALEDYIRHTDEVGELAHVSESFIHRLAVDNARAKQELRNLFRKSPKWNEELDAIVIDGSYIHKPNPERISQIAEEILFRALPTSDNPHTVLTYDRMRRLIDFFANPKCSEAERAMYIDTINCVAPQAYAPGKKPSRIFKNICQELGVANERAGSLFQKLYAQFADELAVKEVNFRLFISVNPAHFLTMSNPKNDRRGETLVSCHSLNTLSDSYNNGCSGYARDNVSFIVFTASNPTIPETLNNRKTTRQIFAYKPGNGLLLQSRMYNTSGGAYGALTETDVYRQLIQREISFLENALNVWEDHLYCDRYEYCVDTHVGFGGYADWERDEFNAYVSMRSDCIDDFETIEIGNYGLCVLCGDEIDSNTFLCGECAHEHHLCCDRCLAFARTEKELYVAHNNDGQTIHICETCISLFYRSCDVCGEYYDIRTGLVQVGTERICRCCLDRMKHPVE